MSSQFERDLSEILSRVHTPADAARAKDEIDELMRRSHGYCPYCGEMPPLRCDVESGVLDADLMRGEHDA